MRSKTDLWNSNGKVSAQVPTASFRTRSVQPRTPKEGTADAARGKNDQQNNHYNLTDSKSGNNSRNASGAAGFSGRVQAIQMFKQANKEKQ